jgi:hypothetical protein
VTGCSARASTSGRSCPPTSSDAVLGDRQAIPAIRRAHRLLLKRFGRTIRVWLVSAVVAIIFVPVFVVVYGFVGAVMSTYRTLAFRRLDLGYAPAYAYPVAPQAPPSPQT